MSNCRICGEKANVALTIENYPMCAGPVTAPDSPPVPTGSISVQRCSSCEVLSLVSLDKPITYGAAYTSSNIPGDGKTEAFLEFAGLKAEDKVLEIGCYDGALMQKMAEIGCEVEGCEPCKWAAEEARRKGFAVRRAGYTRRLYPAKSFDKVVMRNVLEHVGDPVRMLRDVRYALKDDGHAVLVIPNGEVRITGAVLGSVVPEHTMYFGTATLNRALGRAGLRWGTLGLRPGLIMTSATIMSGELGSNPAEPASAEDIEAGVIRRKAKLSEVRRILAGERNIYLFGANTCAVELLADRAVNPEQVVCAVDDDPYRWGKVLVNTRIPVVNRTSRAPMLKPNPFFVVCSYYSQESIIGWLKETLEPPFRILKLYPVAEVIEKCR